MPIPEPSEPDIITTELETAQLVAEAPASRRAHWIALGVLMLITVVALVWWFTPAWDEFNPAEVARWLRSVGSKWWSPLAYIGAYILFTLFLVPAFVLSAAAAVMWGWFAGGVVELVAAMLASIPPYLLARSGGGVWMRRKIEKHGGRKSWERVQHEGFFALLLLRLVPVIPFPVLNYLAGLALVRPVRYLVASFLGMIPSIFLFTYFVDAVAKSTEDLTQAIPRILGAGMAIAILAIVTRVVAARLR